MQILILPGFSDTNKEWVDGVAQNLKVSETIRPFYWMHWSDSNSKFDVEEKAQLIVKHIKGDRIKIIAKSIGTLIALKLLSLIPDQVEKIVLCGLPINDLKPEEVEFVKMMSVNNKDKVTIIQNSNDPHGTFEQVKDFGDVFLKESDNHEYPYFEEFGVVLN